MVSKYWYNVATHEYIWRPRLAQKLNDSWFTITCDQQHFNFHAFNKSFSLYNFLSKFVWVDAAFFEAARFFANGHTLSQWIVGMSNRFRMCLTEPQNNVERKQKVVLLGPGLDRKRTQLLFRRFICSKPESVKPLSLIQGVMGIGSAIRLLITADVQRKNRQIALSSPSFMDCANGNYTKANRIPIFRDLIFDLHQLYSLQMSSKNGFTDEVDRLNRSHLFINHVDPQGNSRGRDLHTLHVTGSVRFVLKHMDGILYAIDASESPDQLCYLRYELRAILRGVPSKVADKIPVAILYIHSNDYDFFDVYGSASLTVTTSSHCLYDASRTSFVQQAPDGKHTHAASSILTPISCLGLCELRNPWRIQSCTNQDTKAVIQSVMWLTSRSPQ